MAASRYSSGTRRVKASSSARRVRTAAGTQKKSTMPKNKKITKQSDHKKKAKQKFFLKGEMDYTLLFLIIVIVAFGLIVMLSASAPAGNRTQNDSYYYFRKQLLFIIGGFVAMLSVSQLNLDRLLKFIPIVCLICVILLGLVLVPGVGVESHGARRWLNIPGIQLQPSELMKPVAAMTIAYYVKMQRIDLKKFKDNAIVFGALAIVSLLLMCETHLSGTIVIVGIAISVMVAAGTPLKPLVIIGIIMGVLVFIYLQFDSVRMARLTTFFNPFADAQGEGYQISQSIYAIGSGKLFGLGLGQSVQKYSNLPEPYNDFIFSIVCEELGFFGGVIVILLFAALFLKSMRIAAAAPDVWSSLTCVGISAQLGIQTFLNMGVAVSIIPNTGVSLPFFSYGGTSVLVNLVEMGILLNVSRKSKRNK